MTGKKFGTAVNCMDGRTQEPVAEYIKARFAVDYVDTITEPGPERILVNGPPEMVESIRTRVAISVEKHGSKVIAVVAHHDCAGNPVTKDQHLKEVRKAVEVIRSWGYDAEVLALWVGPDWSAQVV